MRYRCMNFLYGAVVLFIEEEEDIDEEKEEVEEEEEEPFHEAYAERGREGETRSEVLVVKELDGGDGMRSVEGTVNEHGQNQAGEDEERKKENEPFEVPTVGAFYMHDDRVRDSAGARNRNCWLLAAMNHFTALPSLQPVECHQES